VEISSLRVAQHFTNKVDRVLDFVVGNQLPSFNDNRHTNHIACTRYVKLQGFVGFQGHQGGWGSQVLLEIFERFMCLFCPLKLVLFFEELEEREPPDVES
jgi:hypothetical protein